MQNAPEEQPILFGPQSTLFGMLARPAGQALPVACLMFNFGIHTHIGPRRIQVKLARRLAEQGIASLRFDLSGVGESPMPAGTEQFDSQAALDLATAIDLLEREAGVRRVVLIGLCSGAAHALQHALRDPRVVGLQMFDGYRLASRMSSVKRRFQRLVHSPKAQSIHWIKRLLGLKTVPTDNLLGQNAEANALTAAEFGQAMDTLVARQVSVYLLYSASLQARDRDHDQLAQLRGASFLAKVRYVFMPELDHTFSLLAAQERYLDSTSEWIRDGVLPPAVASGAPAGTASPHPTGRQPSFA